MNRVWKVALLTLLVSVLLVVLSATISDIEGQVPTALAQRAADTPLPLGEPDQARDRLPASIRGLTVNLNIADFENTTFIFAPSTQPALFVDCVDNRYYPLIPGTVYHYRSETDEGLETETVTVTNETKEVLGITATVVHDVVLLDGVLLEDTYDWYAQDVRGNVWYFGEDVSNYEDGQFVDKAGSWEAGVNGAVPGIIMLGQPLPGDVYREEYLAGEAEDRAGILSLNESATVPYDNFDHLLLTANYNPLDGELEHKFYAARVGLVREEVVDAEGNSTGEIVELTAVQWGATVADGDHACDSRDDGDDEDDDDRNERDERTGSDAATSGQAAVHSSTGATTGNVQNNYLPLVLLP
ncbi:MAG: hypothetical protein R3C14_30515 [Caldilineaceae bacterium]